MLKARGSIQGIYLFDTLLSYAFIQDATRSSFLNGQSVIDAVVHCRQCGKVALSIGDKGTWSLK